MAGIRKGRAIERRQRRAWAAPLCAAAGILPGLLLALACASIAPTPTPTPTPTPSVTPTPTPTPTPAPTPASAGCGMQGQATGRQALTIVAGGQTRNYTLLVPAAYDPRTPLALVFVFHGAGGSVDTAMEMGLQDVPAAASSAILVFPQGVVNPLYPNWGTGWDERCNGYDMPFFDAMLDKVTSTYCIDRNRVFATGFSWGADFANNLACCRGDKLRAIAPASGDDAHYNATCGTTVPAFRITYGDSDPDYLQSDFADVVNFERNAHGCSADYDTVNPSPCISYRGCGQPVIECKYAGMGHTWPEDWAPKTWKFFATFP